MKLQLFVTGSAALLATWLGVTYFREVPRENYPQLGRGSLPISAKVTPEESESKTMDALPEEADMEVAMTVEP